MHVDALFFQNPRLKRKPTLRQAQKYKYNKCKHIDVKSKQF